MSTALRAFAPPIVGDRRGLCRHRTTPSSDARGKELGIYTLSDELLRRRAYVGPVLVGAPTAVATTWIMWEEVSRSVALLLPVLLFLSGLLSGTLIPLGHKGDARSKPDLKWLIISGGLAGFVLAGTVASNLTIAFAAFSLALPISGWLSGRALRELRRRERATT